MSQETVKERRMAERGREKGRRTAAGTEREARSGTDTAVPENAIPKLLQESHCEIDAPDRLKRRERNEKSATKRKGAVTFGRSTGRRDDDDDERERKRER